MQILNLSYCTISLYSNWKNWMSRMSSYTQQGISPPDSDIHTMHQFENEIRRRISAKGGNTLKIADGIYFVDHTTHITTQAHE